MSIFAAQIEPVGRWVHPKSPEDTKRIRECLKRLHKIDHRFKFDTEQERDEFIQSGGVELPDGCYWAELEIASLSLGEVGI